MIDALLTSSLSLAIGAGILVTAFLGWLCDPFLKVSVTAELPSEFKAGESLQEEGGGPDLGILERLLFFAAFWMNAHVVAGGWLAFKVAAKWAAWQHIVKLPETLKDEDDRRFMHARLQLSSNLLGRFLNGTLYNIFCASVGWVVAKGLLKYTNDLSHQNLWYWNISVFILVGILIGVPLIVFPILGPTLTEKLWPAKTKKSPRSAKREGQEAKPEGRKRLYRIVLFLVGAIFTLYVVQWFVTILPGPKPNAIVQGFRGTTEKTAGCFYYMIMVVIDAPIEYVYLKSQFPGRINNYKVGLPQEEQTPKGRMAMQAWEAAKDAQGNCTIVQAAVNSSADVGASAAGKMIAIHASKLPPKTLIMGFIATTEEQSSLKRVPIYTEGAYEYMKLGQLVRKLLSISDKGTIDVK